MNARAWLGSEVVWAEMAAKNLHVVRGDASRTWRLERGADGVLTEACRDLLRTELTAFLDRKSWQPRREMRVAISAGGVTLRRWSMPNVDDDAMRPLLALRIESELPLGPDALAWGWVRIARQGPLQDVLVAAVRREAVAEVAQVFEACGLTPRFTLAALARAGSVGPRSPAGGNEAWLDVGLEHAEWLTFDDVGPVRLRVLPWGEQTLVREWTTRLGVGAEAANRWLDRLLREDGAHDERVGPAWEASVRALAGLIPPPPAGCRVRLTGRLAGVSGFAELLAKELGTDVRVESGEPTGDRALPAGLRALRLRAGDSAAAQGLWLSTAVAEAPTVLARPDLRKWGALAALLLAGILALPYVEAVILTPGLAARVEALKSRRDRLDVIDRQVEFLRYLKQNQTPYLETLVVLGKCLPPGSKLESLNLNRKGEMALRVSMRQPPEVTGFRTKLTESGFFASVVIEEQSPSPDRQKIQVRIGGQVQPAHLRQGLKILEPEPAPSTPTMSGGPAPGMPAPPASGPVPGPGPAPGRPPGMSPRPPGMPVPVPAA